jgi:PAS domain S-box-containing protein
MAGESILIVEDSYIVGLHLQKTLEGDGYRVIDIVATAEGSIECFQIEKPDLVLMDITLRGSMNGIEAATIIRDRFFTPVIFITALTDDDTLEQAKYAEPYGYLTKPFEDQDIIKTIRLTLHKHSMEQRVRESEERFSALVNAISDMLITIDNDYKITYLNPAAQAFTGVSLNEGMGKDAYRIVKLVNEEGEVINPFQNPVNEPKDSSTLSNIWLVGTRNTKTPVGEGRLNLIYNHKNEITGMALLLRDLTAKVKQAEAEKKAALSRTAGLLEGQEYERMRVARELHDGVGQLTNALRMKIEKLEEQPDTKNFKHARLLAEEIVHEVKRIAENLLPSRLKDFELSECLEHLCRDITAATGKSIQFNADETALSLPIEKKINLYRIVQEAITNALKHAKANDISVQLYREEGSIQLTIEDNGIGFATSRRNGHGLNNMTDRTTLMGGQIHIESTPGKGTVIMVEVPWIPEQMHSK